MKFKIIFPNGYQIDNEKNDNIDINIILENGEVYFCTLFTLSNIDSLIKKDKGIYFWATDMIIITNLNKNTIRQTIEKLLIDGYLKSATTLIGQINKIYSESEFNNFDELPDMS